MCFGGWGGHVSVTWVHPVGAGSTALPPVSSLPEELGGVARVAREHGPGVPFPFPTSPSTMGLLDFLKDAGKDLFGGRDSALGSNVSNLGVRFDNGRVTLQGEAKSQAAKEKATLIAGNVKGVSHVDDDGIRVAGQQAQTAAAPSSRYYTIQSGDTLSKIAKEHYGDANAYPKIFDANREVIGDPDKIYPGQQIRIPAA